MKRTPVLKAGLYFIDPRRNLSAAQLAHIGAIAMAYNAVEEEIENMVAMAMRLEFDPYEAVSRMGGVENKIEVIKIAAKAYDMPAEMHAALAACFSEDKTKGDFPELKRSRDAVVHARVLDAPTGIGLYGQWRGRKSEVLLTADALEGLYLRLLTLAHERGELASAYQVLVTLHFLDPNDPERVPLAARSSEFLAQYRALRTKRLSLPPLPAFPE